LLALVVMFVAVLLCQQLSVNPYMRMVIAVGASALVYLVVLRLLRFDIKQNVVSALKL
jgi:positive regulator of sigma E activity